MKMWKKLMVPVLVIVLTSALMGAQYIAVETDATLTVDTETADLQIAASDPSLSEDGQQYLLEYDGEGFELDLGTWGEQNAFISSQAFLLVNAGESEIEITGVEIGGTTDVESGSVGANVDIYLSWQEDQDSETGAVQVWDNEGGDQESSYHLNYYPEDIYGEGEMTIWHSGDHDNEADTGTAEYLSYDDGENIEHWVYNDDDATDYFGDDFADGSGETPNANAVWVHIEVVPDEDIEDVQETIRFNVE